LGRGFHAITGNIEIEKGITSSVNPPALDEFVSDFVLRISGFLAKAGI
jgi:hypothetical protein